jgi:hypothetical protein
MIRQRIAQANPKDVPNGWHVRVEACPQQEAREAERMKPWGITQEDTHGGTARNSSLA